MVFSAVGRFAKLHPIKFGCVFSCAKTSFSDWLVQSQLEKRERIDWQRNGTFAAFGFFYLGGVQYFLYVPLFSRLFPSAAAYAAASVSAKLADGPGTRRMIAQVVIDQFVHHPLLYFPAFYSLKEVVKGGTVSEGLARYSNNYKEDLPALWKLWIPSTIINFSLMPMHMRIPWVASTSLIWTCIISYMRGDDMETNPDEAMNIIGGNQGRPLQALYDLGVAAKPCYEYDRSKAHVLLTATGRDKIGFIEEVAGAVDEHTGNILDVKAYKVGREFVTILLAECDPSKVDSMVGALQKGRGVKVSVQHTQPWRDDAATSDSPRCKDGVTYTGHLRANGPDRPGIVLRLTQILAEWQLDITSLEAKQHRQASLATPGEVQQIIQVSGVVRAFTPIDRAQLEAAIIAAEAELGVRIGIEETDPDPGFSPMGTDTGHGKRSLLKTVTSKRGPPGWKEQKEG